MQAVIHTGGKQYPVQVNQKLKVEKLDAMPGDKITFSEILLISNGDNTVVGAPFVAKANVVAEVMSVGRRDKIKIFKMRRRKHSRKRMGHRQWFTEIKIVEINA